MNGDQRRLWREWRGWFLFVALMVLFRSGVADWFYVPSGSMKPTLLEGDRILVDRLAYDIKLPFTDLVLWAQDEPRRGDIVVFSSPHDGRRLVKRLIGLPGDEIALRDNRLYINGMPADYRALTDEGLYENLRSDQLVVEERLTDLAHLMALGVPSRSPLRSFGPVTVPQGQYFMLGDNRDNSADSRVFGFVAREQLSGRAERVVASLDGERYFLPRRDRFWRRLD